MKGKVVYPISVIIPVKNGEKFIAEAIESIINAEVLPAEILIIDGHSTDKTELICSSYKELTFIKQTGTGLEQAFNQGVLESKYDFISFIGSDDIWEVGKLKYQMEAFETNLKAKICITKFKFITDSGCELPANFRKDLLGTEHNGLLLETMLTKREVFEKVGLFNPAFSPHGDFDWFARCKDKGVSIILIPELLVKKRIHENNLFLTSENKKSTFDILRESVKRKQDK